MLDLVNTNMMRGGPGATMPSIPSSTVRDANDEASDDEASDGEASDDETARTKIFRRRARTPSHKDPEELKYRVSLFPNNKYIVPTSCSCRSVIMQTN